MSCYTQEKMNSVTLAIFQGLRSPMWLVATIWNRAVTEYLRDHRTFTKLSKRHDQLDSKTQIFPWKLCDLAQIGKPL